MTLAKHWSSLSPNPISHEAMQFVEHQLAAKHSGPIYDLEGYWMANISGKSLLDIGVVEHAIEFSSRPNWKHAIFKRMAKRLVGVDILPDAVAALNARGFDIRVCDATSDAYLGETFDVVYIGDVIEHVDNPVGLLSFARRHLNAGGTVIATTPCPFWWRNIKAMLQSRTFIGNVDHMRWVCPVHALELAHRSSLELSSYHTLETAANTLPKRVVKGLSDKMLGNGELFTWAYVYVFKAAQSTAAQGS